MNNSSPLFILGMVLLISGYAGVLWNTKGGTNIPHKTWVFLPRSVKSLILDIFILGRFFHKDSKYQTRIWFGALMVLGVLIICGNFFLS